MSSNETKSKRQTVKDRDGLHELNMEIDSLIAAVEGFAKKNAGLIRKLHPQYKAGGENFLHYLALRQFELKDLQLRLSRFGLSSLGRCESNVLNSLRKVQERIFDSADANRNQFLKNGRTQDARLNQFKKAQTSQDSIEQLDWSAAEKILHQHTRDVFGPKPLDRHVYIMTTAPAFVDFSGSWVRSILKAGTNLIRINCAHESEKEWHEMVSCIRKVARETDIPCRILMDLGGPKIRTATPARKKLSVGDHLYLVERVHNDKKDIQCSLPKVLDFIKVGERVLFDDGRIEMVTVSKARRKLELKVTRLPASQVKLKAEKGINFPDSHIKISEVTAQDICDLEFAGVHADLIGLSFVQSPSAIRKIRWHLKKLSEKSPGIILKIETRAGFNSLPRLLLEAMTDYPCGVMIGLVHRLVEIRRKSGGLIQATSSADPSLSI